MMARVIIYCIGHPKVGSVEDGFQSVDLLLILNICMYTVPFSCPRLL